jgi:hypothetical protein
LTFPSYPMTFSTSIISFERRRPLNNCSLPEEEEFGVLFPISALLLLDQLFTPAYRRIFQPKIMLESRSRNARNQLHEPQFYYRVCRKPRAPRASSWYQFRLSSSCFRHYYWRLTRRVRETKRKARTANAKLKCERTAVASLLRMSRI